MRDIKLHIICEGQTEAVFVTKVLAPYLQNFGITSVNPIIVCTNKKKNARGGLINFETFARDLRKTIQSNRDDGTIVHYFSSFVDFYALPNEFPQYEAAKRLSNPYDQVAKLEEGLANAIADARFIPYIQLHEFETFVICGYEHVAAYYDHPKGMLKKLEREFFSSTNPELINGGVNTAPSKRLLTIIKKEYGKSYNKPKMGLEITQHLGIDRLRQHCPHFNEWIEQLSAIAQAAEQH